MPGKKGTVAFTSPLLARPRRARRGEEGNCAILPLPGMNAGPSAEFTKQHHAVAMFHPRKRLPCNENIGRSICGKVQDFHFQLFDGGADQALPSVISS